MGIGRELAMRAPVSRHYRGPCAAISPGLLDAAAKGKKSTENITKKDTVNKLLIINKLPAFFLTFSPRQTDAQQAILMAVLKEFFTKKSFADSLMDTSKRHQRIIVLISCRLIFQAENVDCLHAGYVLGLFRLGKNIK